MEAKPLCITYIRHAQSLFNLWEHYCAMRLNQAELDKYADDIANIVPIKSKFDPLLLDPHLSSKGKEQAHACSFYNSMPIKTVFVSPLRRAMETCDALFSRHPNHLNIKYVVHPLLREILNNANDVPHNFYSIKKEYEPKGYDFSLFDEYKYPHLHFLYTLNDPERKNLLAELDGTEEYQAAIIAAEIAKREMDPEHHRKLETYLHLRKRAIEFAKFSKKFIQENGVDPAEVAVVTHSTFMGYSQAEEFNEYNKAIYKAIPNCGSVLINLSKLTQ